MASFFHLKPDVVGQATTLNGFLSAAECGALIEFGETQAQLRAGKTEDHRIHTQLRQSDIAWIMPDGEHKWLFERIRDCVNEVNQHWFGYHLVGFEGIQFTKYSQKEDRGDFYSSHRDTVVLPGGTVRKLSFTIQLSSPTQYSGGEVLLYSSLIDFAAVSRELGSLTFFPSYTIHEVRPVTTGIRYSLVGWACGPAFV